MSERTRGLKRDELTDEQRCTRIKADGERCKNPKTRGYDECRPHVGVAPTQLAYAKRVRVVEQMRKLRIPMIGNDDEEIRDAAALLRAEIRRTVGWIRFCEDKITALDDDDALVWGKVSEEAEDGVREDKAVAISKVTYGAGANTWLAKLEWNREHLAKLTKMWIDAGFEEARLKLETRALDEFTAAIDAIVADLGFDPNSADVRASVHARLVAVAAALS